MQSNNIILLICGIIFIIIWLISNILVELNNKSNEKELNLLIDKLNNININQTPVTLTFTTLPTELKINNYIIPNKYYINNNLYVVSSYETERSFTTTKQKIGEPVIFGIPTVNGKPMDKDNYIFLARQNPIGFSRNRVDNITYTYNYYAIDNTKEIFKINGLKEFEKELDMSIYIYEYGPIGDIQDNIIKRKQNDNILLKCAGRFITFILLLVGLILVLLNSPKNKLINIINSHKYINIPIISIILTLLVWVPINIIN